MYKVKSLKDSLYKGRCGEEDRLAVLLNGGNLHGLHGGDECSELVVEWSEDGPAGQGESEVDEETAEEESEHIRHRVLQGQQKRLKSPT